MANSMLANLSPAYGMIKGEGAFGDVLGVKSQNAAAAKIASDKAAADEAAVKKAELQAKSQAFAQGRPMKKGGKVSSASSRADGIAQRGKTRGRMV
jgi:hypothetical protein